MVNKKVIEKENPPSPSIQYFIDKLKNAGNLEESERRAIEYVRGKDHRDNHADWYFVQLIANRSPKKKCQVGPESRKNMLNFYEARALEEVQSIYNIKAVPVESAAEDNIPPAKIAANQSGFWYQQGCKALGAAVAGAAAIAAACIFNNN